jgi:molybdopterin adenylyltransferase
MSSSSLVGRHAVVITVSDRCFAGEQEDVSGPALVKLLQEVQADHVDLLLVPDEQEQISTLLRSLALRADVIVTTGGTGLAARDVTPEATLAVCERLVPGLAEAMRQDGLRHTPYAVLSRGVCGVCGNALVLNLPGSPAGAKSSLLAVLPLLSHALDLLAGQNEHWLHRANTP